MSEYKFKFYPIPDLCKCGCGEIVYNGNEWIKGHIIRVNSISKKGRIPWNKGKSGCQKAWNKGIPRPQETKNKISNANKGKIRGIPKTQEHKNNISIALKGKPKSKEHRIKNSDSHKTLEYKNKMSGQNNPFYGKHHTKETKDKIGNRYYPNGKNHANYGTLPSPAVSHGKRCYYESSLQGLICFRSSFELAYAKYLDDNKILWMYEEFTFELSDELTYTPDFFLPKFEKFVEIKGYMRKDAKCKVDKFKEEYPFDLEILYKEDLIKLGCNIK